MVARTSLLYRYRLIPELVIELPLATGVDIGIV